MDFIQLYDYENINIKAPKKERLGLKRNSKFRKIIIML